MFPANLKLVVVLYRCVLNVYIRLALLPVEWFYYQWTGFIASIRLPSLPTDFEKYQKWGEYILAIDAHNWVLHISLIVRSIYTRKVVLKKFGCILLSIEKLPWPAPPHLSPSALLRPSLPPPLSRYFCQLQWRMICKFP